MFDPRQILYENSQVLLVYKPAGIAVQSSSVGQMDLEHQILGYLSAKSRGREIPYLAVVHRLDQPVEGILLFAKTKEAAAFCTAQLQKGTMKKEYLAVVQKTPDLREDTLTDYLLKDGRSNSSKVVQEGTKGAKRSQLRYQVLKEGEKGHCLLGIQLMTGRHHQIRVQLSHAGMPIVGDRKYGGASLGDQEQFSDRNGRGELLLCAASLTFVDPESKEKKRIEIQPRGRGFQDFKTDPTEDV